MDKLVTDNNCSRLNSGKRFRVYAFNSAAHCNPTVTLVITEAFPVKSKLCFSLFFHFVLIQNDLNVC